MIAATQADIADSGAVIMRHAAQLAQHTEAQALPASQHKPPAQTPPASPQVSPSMQPASTPPSSTKRPPPSPPLPVVIAVPPAPPTPGPAVDVAPGPALGESPPPQATAVTPGTVKKRARTARGRRRTEDTSGRLSQGNAGFVEDSRVRRALFLRRNSNEFMR